MMKKTVTLTNLIKAKSDLELFIKLDELKRLKKLFDPTFDIKELNSKIEKKEDQLIIIKEVIAYANATNKDSEGKSLNNSIYLLSKYNRFKANLLTLSRKLETDKLINGTEQSNEKLKTSLLTDIQDLDSTIKKETDKKKKVELQSSKTKLKRSLSKLISSNKSEVNKMETIIEKDLKLVEEKISSIKGNLSKLNDSINVEIELFDEFELVVK